MGTVRVVIADDNLQTREMLAQFLAQQNGIEIAGTANNGLEAIEQVQEQEPDVLICDMIMPQMDGYGVLEHLQSMKLARMPGVIVLTALSRDDFIARAINLGACYYMVKPFDFTLLAKRVFEVAGEKSRAEAMSVQPGGSAASAAGSLEERIANLFLTVGIPAHIKGYQYLREAVRMVLDNHEVINRITKELYPGIARKFDTSASKVERAMRHAIEVAWTRGRLDTVNQMYGYKVFAKDDKPTNGEFISCVAEKIGMAKSA